MLKNLKIILIKITWIELNINYITKIIHIYSILNKCFEEKDFLIKSMEDILNNQNLRYLTNETKHPKITTEVNYYLILASIYYSIIPPRINFKNIKINDYFISLKNALIILQNLKDDLYIFLNEMYIIDELFHIYNVLLINDKLNIELLNNISINLKTNNEILQKDKPNIDNLLNETFVKLYELINQALNYEDKEYYELLKYIFFKEIKKVPDINYLFSIFENMSEIIVNSNDILQILLKGIIIH